VTSSTIGILAIGIVGSRAGGLTIVVLCRNATSDRVASIFNQACRIAGRVGVDLRPMAVAAAGSGARPASLTANWVFAFFFGLLLLIEAGGSGSTGTSSQDREGLSQAAVRALSLARTRFAAVVFNQTSDCSTGKTCTGHMLATLGLASIVIASLLRASRAEGAATRTGASAGAALTITAILFLVGLVVA
jgi:hypothetical protein